MNNYQKYFLISIAVIILDQLAKMLVYFNMDMGVPGQIQVFGDFFKLHYLTNPGMAFGMKLGTAYGKPILTVFRLFAMAGIAYYLYMLIRKGMHPGLLFCVALILGGAVGNVIDSTLYGVLLDNAPYDAPMPWFYGQVIDMFYFDIWEGSLPGWLPIIGGDYMSLWPVFNVADASIFVGVCIILVFQKKYFKPDEKVQSSIEQEAAKP